MCLLNFNITLQQDSYYDIQHAKQLSPHLPPKYVYYFLVLNDPIITIYEVAMSIIFRI